LQALGHGRIALAVEVVEAGIVTQFNTQNEL
jgi:hypothetical protein